MVELFDGPIGLSSEGPIVVLLGGPLVVVSGPPGVTFEGGPIDGPAWAGGPRSIPGWPAFGPAIERAIAAISGPVALPATA